MAFLLFSKLYKQGGSPQKRRFSEFERGFTLTELIVVLTIMIVISSLVLARYSAFDSTTILTNLSYDIALSLREAQLYSIGVREGGESELGKNEADTFSFAYGVRFGDNPTGESYLFYEDQWDTDGNSPSDGRYNPGFGIKEYTLRRGHTIKDFCGINGSVKTCSAEIDALDISFKRPNPDAIIYDTQGVRYSEAEITIQSREGATKKVHVYTTGQIAVDPQISAAPDEVAGIWTNVALFDGTCLMAPAPAGASEGAACSILGEEASDNRTVFNWLCSPPWYSGPESIYSNPVECR